MASEVDIANLALAHLGDNATVASLDPPEGSVQAEHAARFFPIARDSLLELHNWGFATKRVTLALLGSGSSGWLYTYARPSDAINVIDVLPPDSITPEAITFGGGVPRPFECEIDSTGAEVIYTNQEEAVLRYTGSVTDTTAFTPLFVMALSWHLASMLAGPILKGEVGAAEGKRCAQMMQMYLSRAMASDAGQRQSAAQHLVGWITGR